MRKDGTRFPVLIIEAPLINAQGLHTGWMSAFLDISEQRRVEELSRASQERLQATARLATVGEMASLLSHELNQPLAAISSYATGSLNLLEPPSATDPSPALKACRTCAWPCARSPAKPSARAASSKACMTLCAAVTKPARPCLRSSWWTPSCRWPSCRHASWACACTPWSSLACPRAV